MSSGTGTPAASGPDTAIHTPGQSGDGAASAIRRNLSKHLNNLTWEMTAIERRQLQIIRKFNAWVYCEWQLLLKTEPTKAQQCHEAWQNRRNFLLNNPKSLQDRYNVAHPESQRLDQLAYSDWLEVKTLWDTRRNGIHSDLSDRDLLAYLLDSFIEPAILAWNPRIRFPHERDPTTEERALLLGYRKQLLDAEIKYRIRQLQGASDEARLSAAREERENSRGSLCCTEESDYIVDRHDKVAELELCVLAYQDFEMVEKFWKDNTSGQKPEALSVLAPGVMQPVLDQWSFKISTS